MEQISDLGYLALKKETTKGTPVTPDVFLPIYNESLSMNYNLNDINPIMGLKAMRFTTIQGQRDYQGDISFLGEPNTAGYVFDMLLRKGTTTGDGPYTHPFTLSTTDNPNSYTVDIKRGRFVYRFFGVEARAISAEFEDNSMRLNASVSALGMFAPSEITNVNTNTLTLSTAFSSTPTKGLVASDLIRIFRANGTVVDTTVSSLTDTTVTVASAGSAQNGDIVCIRPATPTYSLVDVFQFARSQFKFGADASAALSANHTPVQEGSGWNIIHAMLPDEGRKASGSHDPVSLVRGLGDIEINTRIFHDTPDDERRFVAHEKRAIVISHLAGTGYELRITGNNLAIAEKPVNLEVGEVLFSEAVFKARYDTSDGAMFGVTVINNIATI